MDDRALTPGQKLIYSLLSLKNKLRSPFEWDNWIVPISLILGHVIPTQRKTTACDILQVLRGLLPVLPDYLYKQIPGAWKPQRWRTAQEHPTLQRKERRCTSIGKNLDDVGVAPKLHREAENWLALLQRITWFHTGQARRTRVSCTWHLSDSDKLQQVRAKWANGIGALGLKCFCFVFSSVCSHLALGCRALCHLLVFKSWEVEPSGFYLSKSHCKLPCSPFFFLPPPTLMHCLLYFNSQGSLSLWNYLFFFRGHCLMPQK